MTTRRDEIVEAALTVAQDRGLAAMSMRAVADQAGGGVMALYRHVASKDALLDALVGRMLAEVALPDPDEPWRRRLRDLGRETHDLAARYPTLVPLLLTRTYVAPAAVEVVAATRAILRDAGVAPSDLARTERMVNVFFLGYATSAANGAFWSDPEAVGPPAEGSKESTTPPGTWRAELDRNIQDIADLLEHRAAAAR